MNTCLVICGPTASGKSGLALSIADLLPVNIINADSRQIVKEFPILSDIPSQQKHVPHFLYGYKSIAAHYSYYDWCLDAAEIIQQSFINHRVPVLVGGTGFYVKNLIDGLINIPSPDCNVDFLTKSDQFNLLKQYDPALTINPNDTYRITRSVKLLLTTGKPMSWWKQIEKQKLLPNVKFIKIYLDPGKDIVKEKCAQRLHSMFPAALDEVRPFIDSDYKVIGLKNILQHLHGEIDFTTMQDMILQETLQYAKRQRTWFQNQMEFDLKLIHPSHEALLQIVNSYLIGI
jgi:tRNA dimethylallyltransferase